MHTEFLNSSPKIQCLLSIDSDIQPLSWLAASLIVMAEEEEYNMVSLWFHYGFIMVSFSSQFILKDVGEWWLQPALLMTLSYQLDSTGVREQSLERVIANSQCFLSRQLVLEQLEEYSGVAISFWDDVTFICQAAR